MQQRCALQPALDPMGLPMGERVSSAKPVHIKANGDPHGNAVSILVAEFARIRTLDAFRLNSGESGYDFTHAAHVLGARGAHGLAFETCDPTSKLVGGVPEETKLLPPLFPYRFVKLLYLLAEVSLIHTVMGPFSLFVQA